MKRKIKSAKGFTLAELLIVVAIIAVLVAIGIPIFTSQLEKSREAVDLSDVRSAYAEVMMAAITGDTTAIYTKDANQTIYKQAENVYSITVKPLKQKQDGWQTALPITIGGVSSTDNAHWVGTPGANGECVITYVPPTGAADEAVKFEWKGGTGEDNSGTGGNGGGISGGNSGTGESTNPSGSGNNTGGNVNSDTKLPSDLDTSVVDWDKDVVSQSNYTIEKGIVYRSGNNIYFGKCEYYMNSWSLQNQSIETLNSWSTVCKYTGKVFDSSDFGKRDDVTRGDVCKVGNDYYFFADGGNRSDGPIVNPEQWVKIIIK